MIYVIARELVKKLAMANTMDNANLVLLRFTVYRR